MLTPINWLMSSLRNILLRLSPVRDDVAIFLVDDSSVVFSMQMSDLGWARCCGFENRVVGECDSCMLEAIDCDQVWRFLLQGFHRSVHDGNILFWTGPELELYEEFFTSRDTCISWEHVIIVGRDYVPGWNIPVESLSWFGYDSE